MFIPVSVFSLKINTNIKSCDYFRKYSIFFELYDICFKKERNTFESITVSIM